MLGKKCLVASCVLLAGAAQAMHMGTPHVLFPELTPGWELSVTGLGLKPGASNLNYVIYNKELPAQSPSWTERELQPGLTAAFAIGARYIFLPNMDLSLEWTHLDSNTSDSTTAPNASFFLGPDYQIGPNSIPIRDASGKVNFKYDVINLDVGQYIVPNPLVALRFFGGLSYLDLREHVTATYTGTLLTGQYTGPFSTQQQVYADYYGLGPRFGMAFRSNVWCGFGLVGEAAVSGLIGHASTVTKFLSSAPQLLALFRQTENYQYIKDQNVSQAILGFDTKLGISYKYAYNRSLLSLEAGYKAAVYGNALHQYLPGTLVTPSTTGGIFVATMAHTISNFSVHGPYLKASVKFDAC